MSPKDPFAAREAEKYEKPIATSGRVVSAATAEFLNRSVRMMPLLLSMASF